MQPEIDQSETLRGELEDLNAEQDLFKKTNVTGTQTRIKLHNTMYNNFMVRVGKLGKMVFKNDFGKFQRYLLPKGSEPAEVISIQGIVTGTPGGAPLEGARIKIIALGLEVDTDNLGAYLIGGLPSGNYTLEIQATDYVDQTILVSIISGTPFTLNIVMVHV